MISRSLQTAQAYELGELLLKVHTLDYDFVASHFYTLMTAMCGNKTDKKHKFYDARFGLTAGF